MLVLAVVWWWNPYNLLPRKSYTAADFGITALQSGVDFNANGLDDAADLLLGARKDAERHPKYDGRYFPGGFPPEELGVCSDVIWRAFREAGYDLRAMVNADIAAAPAAYPGVETPDPAIDFRRVCNLRVFFDRYACSCTLEPAQIADWQPGDLVVFGADEHIGVISDKRNAKGIPYVIHNAGQPVREEDYFRRTAFAVTGHYRFSSHRLPRELLLRWRNDS